MRTLKSGTVAACGRAVGSELSSAAGPGSILVACIVIVSKEMAGRGLTLICDFGGFRTVVTLMVIALVVVVIIVRAGAHIIQHHADDFRAHVHQQLPRTTHDVARALAAMNDQQNAIDD